jgi:penicillin-binding protein 1A
MVTAYSVFANGGFRINPFVVREIRDGANQVLAVSAATEAGSEENRVIDPRNAFLMDAMLRDVTLYGTAARASAILKRQDLAGKTGTTNEYLDAWFCGYQMTVSGCAWVGFDQPRKLGDKETGGAAALPIWIGYMSRALKDVPMSLPQQPEGLVAYGEGKDRTYVYTENVKENDPEDGAADATPLPKPDLSAPPSD